ncbi:hypothetical protein VTN00DRAFT_4589 [Thermoascus crustaceus]|uniref:uncharacterized protein n=1 Tax=Thermoascus crustaceus TaxID=5088 RepID=UPI003743E501
MRKDLLNQKLVEVQTDLLNHPYLIGKGIAGRVQTPGGGELLRMQIGGSCCRTTSYINTGPLEALIEQFDLYINNEPEVATRPKSTPGISIIDLSLTTQDLGPLPCWLVEQDCLTGSDHELILMEWEDLEKASPGQPSSEVTGWHIQGLLEDAETLNKAVQAWQALAAHRQLLSDACVEADVAEKAVWIQEFLTQILNEHAKQL